MSDQAGTRAGKVRGAARGGAPLTQRIRRAAHRASAWFLAVLVASLIAFTWQSFVTGSHLDPTPGAFAGARATAGQSSQWSRPTRPDRPIECPICYDSAIAGHYLPPAPALILIVMAPAIWRFAAPARAKSRRARSHRWQSRAPPRRPA